MFDMPVDTTDDRRQYRWFRKFLITNGFMMMQESIYTKIVLNQSSVDAVLARLEKHKPPKGLVQVLTVTERQFERMIFLVGEVKSDIISTDERLLIL